MKKKISICITLAFILMAILPYKVFADIGPKPSVQINFCGLQDEKYYVTLLSSVESTGPYSHVDYYTQAYGRDEEYTEDIWKSFQNFEDTDSFYFLSYIKNCSDEDKFAWTYYPPEEFKVLIYFPEKNSFICTDILNRYAFDSYFNITIKDLAIETNMIYIASKEDSSIINQSISGFKKEPINENNLVIKKSYNYFPEILSMIIRIILTIAIELLVAIIFKYRTINLMKIILFTNILTQIVLNAALNIIAFYYGSMILIFYYILLEAAVIIIEALIYRKALNKRLPIEKQSKIKPVIYSIAANSVSFAVGYYLSIIVPGIF